MNETKKEKAELDHIEEMFGLIRDDDVDDGHPFIGPSGSTGFSRVAEQVMALSESSLAIIWPNVRSMSDLDIERGQFVAWCYLHPEHTDWGEALMEYRHGKGD